MQNKVDVDQLHGHMTMTTRILNLEKTLTLTLSLVIELKIAKCRIIRQRIQSTNPIHFGSQFFDVLFPFPGYATPWGLDRLYLTTVASADFEFEGGCNSHSLCAIYTFDKVSFRGLDVNDRRARIEFLSVKVVCNCWGNCEMVVQTG